MTCVVGVENGGKVYMGADSSASDDNIITVTRIPKIFKVKNILFGCTYSFRMIQLLTWNLDFPKYQKEEADFEYLSTVFVDSVRDCFKKGGFLNVENGIEKGGNFLIGFNGKLYEMLYDFAVDSSDDGFMAIGSGKDFALGSLYSTDRNLDPMERVSIALRAAEHYSKDVCYPFEFMSL